MLKDRLIPTTRRSILKVMASLLWRHWVTWRHR